jgi:hypothetical protein
MRVIMTPDRLEWAFAGPGSRTQRASLFQDILVMDTTQGSQK